MVYSALLTEYHTLDVVLEQAQPFPLPTPVCSLPPGEEGRR